MTEPSRPLLEPTGNPGFHGRVLHVDLTQRAVWVSEPPPDTFRQYAGGSLLALRHLMLQTPPGLDPYAPEAPLIFASSVVAGHPYVGLPRFSVVAKSPLTGGLGEARAEGQWGLALKASGADAVVITGRAARPCYLLVEAGRVGLEPAEDLWGADTAVTAERLGQRHGPEARVAAIGRAGERMVRYASIVTDSYFAAPRMGLGAVMGSKNLKAVVLAGGRAAPVAKPGVLADLTAAYATRMSANPQTRVQHEPPGFGAWIGGGEVITGYLGVENYRTSHLPDLFGFTAARLLPHLVWSDGGCPGCPNDCIKGFGSGAGTLGLHQEALAALGPGLGISDELVVLELAATCQREGIDPVSLGFTLGWLFECVERGLIARDAAGAAGFGDLQAIRALVRAVAERDGPGDWLAEGVARAAARFGGGTERYALHSKGLELVSFDPRSSAGQGLAYAVSPVGPRYDIVEHDIDFDPVDGHPYAIANMRSYGLRGPLPMGDLGPDKVRNVKVLLDMWSGLDALNVCLFAGPPVRLLSLPDVARMVSAATGWDVGEYEIIRWGQRRLHLARLYNLREGLTAADDRLPDRFHDEPVDAGRHKGAVLDREVFSAARELYYSMSGWDADGVPLPATLTDHDLDWAAPGDRAP
jgi:aldehyde:ferredoxin oxidoreductase